MSNKNEVEMYAVVNQEEILVFGNTYPRKRTLGMLAGKHDGMWDKRRNVWRYAYSESAAEAIGGHVDGVYTSGSAKNGQSAQTNIAPVPTASNTPAAGWLKPYLEKVPDWYVPPSYFEDVMEFLEDERTSIVFTGGAGNGKSTTARIALEAYGYDEVLILDANSEITVGDLLGEFTFEQTADGQAGEKWVDGIVTKAFRAGLPLIIEEFDTIDPRVSVALNSALLPSGERAVNLKTGETVTPENNAPIILTMNTTGTGRNRTYTGRATIDGATADRLSILSTTYENEAAILTSHGYSQENAAVAVEWATTTRDAIDREQLPIILSPRTLMNVCKALGRGHSLEKAVAREFYGKQNPTDAEVLLSVTKDVSSKRLIERYMPAIA